jgi:hypothetical protein
MKNDQSTRPMTSVALAAANRVRHVGIDTTKDLTITIPAGIAEQPGLSLLERIVLDHIHRFPACSNRRLAKRTGLSVRGIEAMLARLRKHNFVRPVGRGRSRRHELLFDVEHHMNCGKNESEKSHTKCGPQEIAAPACTREPTMAEFAELQLSFCEICFERGLFEAARLHLVAVRERLEQDTEIPAEQKSKLLAALTQMEDRCFCYGVGEQMAEGLPASQQRALAVTFCRASTSQIALFRQCVESGELPDKAVTMIALRSG